MDLSRSPHQVVEELLQTSIEESVAQFFQDKSNEISWGRISQYTPGPSKLGQQEYREKIRELENEFRSVLQHTYRLDGNPKADKVWSMAWELGHSSGYSEVEIWYQKLAELVK